MFELIGHSVLKLRRVQIGFLTDENLKPGHWRYLSPGEVTRMMKPPKSAQSPLKSPLKSRKGKRT
jgi:16S rRNA U516 pseudouridylate synthase RsuA-like enzyme